jgi:hypothetical protein
VTDLWIDCCWTDGVDNINSRTGTVPLSNSWVMHGCMN